MTAGEPPHLNLMKTSSGEVGADFSWTPHCTFGSLERTHTAGLVPVWVGERAGGVSERRFAAAAAVLCCGCAWLCCGCAYVPGVLLPTPVESVTPAARS